MAILLAAVVTGLRLLLNPNLGSRGPFLLYILAVAAAAQIAGALSGLMVTVLGGILIEHGAPASDIYMPTVLGIFGVVGAALSIFGGWRRRMEEDLRRIRYNLETAQQIAHIGSWESDSQGRIWASDQTCRIFGVSPGAALQFDDLYALVHPDDREAVRRALSGALQNGSDYDLEHRIVIGESSEVRYVHQQARVLAGGRARLIGSIRDITVRRRGEMAQQILSGLLQMCSACRRIHDRENDQWHSLEGYLHRHGGTRISHGMCPQCGDEWLAREANDECVSR